MQEKRKRILQMLESGTISMDEALTLLEKLQSDSSASDQEHQESKQKFKEAREEKKEKKQSGNESYREEPSMDEFLDSLRRDFTLVGDRFMQFMQTAVQKVKDIDIESPFGKSFVFNHTVTNQGNDIDEILLTIPSGKVTIHESDEHIIRSEFTIKGYSSESEEEAKRDLLEKIRITEEDNKLSISSELKIGQVDLDLYLPKKEYKVVTARLTNGRFKAENMHVNLLKVKSSNGAIRLKDIVSRTVEAETMNGLIYVEGDIEEVEARSLNGAVAVTTRSERAEKIDAKTMTGLVELYVPSHLSLSGKLTSSMGRIDVGLDDVELSSDEGQLFQKSTHFYKELAGQERKLRIKGETKTGNVLIRYNV